ncbi:hypothetical protein AUF78_10260 [archaeon 13_1_20CM_2_51_12]|nr:MAG: hypothetical protein AUF78_10260 [archaeon 13_1_20CM_2_51_12]
MSKLSARTPSDRETHPRTPISRSRQKGNNSLSARLCRGLYWFWLDTTVPTLRALAISFVEWFDSPP